MTFVPPALLGPFIWPLGLFLKPFAPGCWGQGMLVWGQGGTATHFTPSMVSSQGKVPGCQDCRCEVIRGCFLGSYDKYRALLVMW